MSQLIPITVIECFTLKGKTYAPGMARVPQEEIVTLLRKNLISAEESGSPDYQPTALEGQLVAILQPLSDENEGPVDVLTRLVEERTFFEDKMTAQKLSFNSSWREAQDEISSLKNQVAALSGDHSNNTPSNEEIKTQTQGQTQAQTDEVKEQALLTAEELSNATTARAAVALLNAGYNTRAKLRAATDAELEKLDQVGDTSVAKIREFLTS